MVLRIYPFVLHGLLRAASRAPGAPAFLGLARAARNTLTPALPAFALVLALTVAACAGLVRNAVGNGEVAASWKAAGADVTISGSPTSPAFALPPAAVRAISAVPGVTHAAAAWPSTWLTPDGGQLTVLAVDPASYAALTAAAPGYPAVSAGALSRPAAPGAPQPVLASPQAAALLKHSPVKIGSANPLGPVTVQVADAVAATPGWPAGGAFAIMPLAALQSTATPPAPARVTELLLTGSHIDRARLSAVLHADLPPGSAVIYRADVLAGLTAAPLPHGASTLITLSLLVAAVLGLAVMFLELALGAAERSVVLARLATMGLGEGLGGRARGAARGAGGRGRRLGLRPDPPPGAGPGHRPVGVHPLAGAGAAGPRGQLRGAGPAGDGCRRHRAAAGGLLVLAGAALAVEIGWTRRRGRAAQALRMGG